MKESKVKGLKRVKRFVWGLGTEALGVGVK